LIKDPVQVHNRYGHLDDSEEESVWNLLPDDSPSPMDESPTETRRSPSRSPKGYRPWTGSLINFPCPCGGPLENWLFEALLFTLFFVEEIEVLSEVVAVWKELDVLCDVFTFFSFGLPVSRFGEGFDCKNNPKCSNCGKPHMASSKDCQHFIREKEIQKIKSEKKNSYPKARRFVSELKF
jgi:hypothetical protein